MGTIKRIGKFGLGGAVGAIAGVVGGLFFAPDSGNETQKKVRERISLARAAGAEAQTSKERELIARFRSETNDQTAFIDAASETKTGSETKLVAVE